MSPPGKKVANGEGDVAFAHSNSDCRAHSGIDPPIKAAPEAAKQSGAAANLRCESSSYSLGESPQFQVDFTIHRTLELLSIIAHSLIEQNQLLSAILHRENVP
jgi:hypothetical protein